MHWNSWKKSIYSKSLRNSFILNKWRRRSLRYLVVKRGFLFSIFHFCIFHFCFFYFYHFFTVLLCGLCYTYTCRIEYFYKQAVVNFIDSRESGLYRVFPVRLCRKDNRLTAICQEIITTRQTGGLLGAISPCYWASV